MSSSSEARQLRELAFQLLNAGQSKEAEQVFDLLINLGAADSAVLDSLIVLLVQRGDYIKALPVLDAAVGLNPRNPNYYTLRGVCFIETRRYSEAAEAARQAIALSGDDGEPYANLSIALNKLGRNDEALVAIDQALRLEPGSSSHLVNRGNVLRDLGRPEEALEAVDRACIINPTFASAHYNRGNILQDLGRHAEAARAYDLAVELDPSAADAHWNRSLCHLLLGNHAVGWPEYEWRWKRSIDPVVERHYAAPRWTGQEDIAGKSILLHCEQGFGDSIQFVRYAARLAEMGATVVVAAQQSLADILKTAPGVARVVLLGEAPPPTDYHCPIMSLPLSLWPTDPAIPSLTPYLRAEPEYLEKWRARLAGASAPRVGLVHGGNLAHGNDRNRSIPIEAFLDALPGGPAYYVLQKDLRPGDAAAIASRGDIVNLADEIETFADTAAICELLDLVISVDTSVAHLAGALGRPLWALIPFNPDWRWGLETEKSDWYPTARVRRQTVRGDWSETLAAMKRDLSIWFAVGQSA
jgi:hypothetical protein